MRRTVLVALAWLIITGTAGSIVIARAQPAPPPSGIADPSGPPDRPAWMHGGDRHRGQGMLNRYTFALVYPQDDRKLTPPDVQKIAEAYLLWRGNHAWKVVEVAPAADGAIGFALATPEGSIIARFTMDPHNGRVTRTG
jgi:hypothetical protein